jgi:hypothetical protein
LLEEPQGNFDGIPETGDRKNKICKKAADQARLFELRQLAREIGLRVLRNESVTLIPRQKHPRNC